MYLNFEILAFLFTGARPVWYIFFLSSYPTSCIGRFDY